MRQMEGPYLAIHVLQPLEPQVGNNSRGAIIYWEDVYLELLRCCCHNLWGKPKEKRHHLQISGIWQIQDLQCCNPEIWWHFSTVTKPLSYCLPALAWGAEKKADWQSGNNMTRKARKVALFCKFTCYGSWLSHIHASLNWVQYCPIFLSITLVSIFMSGGLNSSLTC